LRFRIGADHESGRVKSAGSERLGKGRHGGQIVGLDSREHGADIGRAVQVGVDGDDAVDRSRKKLTDGTLADGFTVMKHRILAHVAEIRRQQHQAFGSVASQRFRGEEQRDQLVVGLVQRHIDDRRRGSRAGRDPHLAVRKPVQDDVLTGKAKLCRQPSRIIGAIREGMK
jgi:hypothetical protein